jgi:phage terminase small subunit
VTEKQKLFANEYLVDLNATRAYKAVYKSVKNDDVAAQAGSRLLRNVKVADYISERMKEREKRTEITQDMVLKELASIAFDDIKNYLAFKTVKTQIGVDDDGEPIIDYRTVVDMRDSDLIDTKNIAELSIGKDGQFKFKLYCRDNALIQLGKHLGMFTDKVELSGSINNEVEIIIGAENIED